MGSIRTHYSSTRRLRRAFTLIEMLVVIAIIGTITMIVVVSQSSFNKSIILANAAYDMALTIRSAETYGIGSRVIGAGGASGYGIHVGVPLPQNTFTLFADTYPGPSTDPTRCHPADDASAPDAKAGNCAYDSTQESVGVTDYKLGNGITINKFCATTSAGQVCTPTLSSVDVVFTRPNAEPFMSANGAYSVASPVTSLCFSLTSPQGGQRYVLVSYYGEIDASITPCL